MRKPHFVITFLICWAAHLQAQQIICERTFSWRGGDLLFNVVNSDSGFHLACGGMQETREPVTREPALFICKINAFCDTVWSHKTEVYGVSPKFLRHKNGDLFLVAVGSDYQLNRRVWFSKLRPNGTSIIKHIINPFSFEISPYTLISGTNSSVIIACNTIDTATNGGLIALVSVDTSGIVLWTKLVRDHPTINFCHHIEPTPQKTFIMSGTAGSRIWAMEFDSNGTELRRQTFYQAPSRDIYKESAVQQAPDGRLIVSGFYSGSTVSFYLASHDGWSTRKFWGGEQGGYIPKPTILDDGSVAFNDLRRLQSFFTKIDKDSSLQWSTPLPYSSNFTGVRLKDLVFNQDSSTTAVGYYSDLRNSFAEDYFVARISGVGVPYDPTTPVATRPQLGSRGGISIWPQPASHANGGTLHFSGFAGPATLALFNMKGQQVLPVPGTAGTTALLPRQPVPIGHLPPGLYVYRLVAKDRVWTGKVVIGE